MPSPKLSAGRVHASPALEPLHQNQQLVMGHEDDDDYQAPMLAPPPLVLDAGPVHHAGVDDQAGPIHHANVDEHPGPLHQGDEEAAEIGAPEAIPQGVEHVEDGDAGPAIPQGDGGGMPPAPSLDKLLAEPRLLPGYADSIKGISPPLDAGKIYVAISVMQRGDFHKFKWSIATSKKFHVFIPINAHENPKELALHKEQIYKAQTMEKLAPGQWSFINSYQIVSKFDDSEIEVGRFRMQGLQSPAISEMGGLANLSDDETAVAAIDAWAEEEMVPGTIHDINSLVPFFNSDLVMGNRARVLDTEVSEHVGALLTEIAPAITGKDVLVFWGNRTGGGKKYMEKGVAAREFRHKSSQALYQELSSAAESKFVLKAGDPLVKVDAQMDLTQMWDASAMKERYGIDHAFDRMEQEAFFYHLAKQAGSTLHVGMQSGNIEPLINNPNTNVICINENDKGGAGLTNVDKISATREKAANRKSDAPVDEQEPDLDQEWDEKLDRKEQDWMGSGGVKNLYLSFKVSVLPSFIGEFSRLLMGKYGESVGWETGVRRLLLEMGLQDGDESQSIVEQVAMYIMQNDQDQLEENSRSSMLGEFNADDVHTMLLELHAKFNRAEFDDPNGDDDWGDETPELEFSGQEDEIDLGNLVEPAFIRPEIQLLKELVNSSNPKVQYILKSFAELITTQEPSLKDKALRKLLLFVSGNKDQFYDSNLVDAAGGMAGSLMERLGIYIENGDQTIAQIPGGDARASYEEQVQSLKADRDRLLALGEEESVRLDTMDKSIFVEKVDVMAVYRKLKYNGIGNGFKPSSFSEEDLRTIRRAGEIMGEDEIVADIDRLLAGDEEVREEPVEDVDEVELGGFNLFDDSDGGDESDSSPT